MDKGKQMEAYFQTMAFSLGLYLARPFMHNTWTPAVLVGVGIRSWTDKNIRTEWIIMSVHVVKKHRVYKWHTYNKVITTMVIRPLDDPSNSHIVFKLRSPICRFPEGYMIVCGIAQKPSNGFIHAPFWQCLVPTVWLERVRNLGPPDWW